MHEKLLALLCAVAIGTAVFAAVGMLSSPQQAEASDKVMVTISSDVIAGFFPVPIRVGAQVSGPADSLTGRRFHAPRGGLLGPPGNCLFPLAGSLVGDVVTLSGVTTFTNHRVVPVGVPVTFVADASTGDITWTFDVGAVIAGGPLLIFTGTGSVVIAHQ